MDKMRAFEIFVSVAENSSFVGAVDELQISAAAASRYIAELERELGTRLFHRTTRSVSLTSAGREYLPRIQQILGDINDAEQIMRNLSMQPSGLLKISAPLSFGITTLSKPLSIFRQKYPKIELNIELDDRVVDLNYSGIDVALRISRELQGEMIARKIMPIRMILCASPQYFKNGETLKTPENLKNFDILLYSYLGANYKWRFTNDDKQIEVDLKPIISSNNGDILAQMAAENSGIVLQPDFIVEKYLKSGKLIEILPQWEIGEYYLYAIYLSRKFLPTKTRLFIDFLVEYFKD